VKQRTRLQSGKGLMKDPLEVWCNRTNTKIETRRGREKRREVMVLLVRLLEADREGCVAQGGKREGDEKVGERIS